MKKRILAALLASATFLSFAGCASNTASTPDASAGDSSNAGGAADNGGNAGGDNGGEATPDAPKVNLPAAVAASDAAKNAGTGIKLSDTEGKVFNIYAWNEEFKGFFEKYYTVPEGVTVNWVIKPSDDGVYQDNLDQALKGQASADADSKVDLFLAEADYIIKYVNSDYTMDISKIGVDRYDTEYEYTVAAATDASGATKGVSFQCCPAALIYRRSIAEEVLGTSDPAEVQEKLSDWSKFNAAAKTAKEKGYYMTASYVETFRTFSNNTKGPWVDAENNLVIDSVFEDWMTQTADFVQNEYTLNSGVWGDEKNAQMFKDGKTMCFFGPAWYYNFCMGNAQDPEAGCSGDWAICQGPQAFFWGGTWLLAAEGSDNPEMIADILNAFTANEDICSKLVENEMQFTNNMAVNQKFAEDPNYGNAFLGGQNDTAVFVELAKNIKFENKTQYDQLLSEKFPEYMLDYFTGKTDKETALQNFYTFVNEKYPAITTP